MSPVIVCVEDNIALTYLHRLADCEPAQKKKKPKQIKIKVMIVVFKLFHVKRIFVDLIASPVF